MRQNFAVKMACRDWIDSCRILFMRVQRFLLHRFSCKFRQKLIKYTKCGNRSGRFGNSVHAMENGESGVVCTKK